MRAFHGAPAERQGIHIKLLHSQKLQRQTRCRNVHDAVHRSHFVKVDAVNGCAVDFRLSFPQRPEYRQNVFPDTVGQSA